MTYMLWQMNMKEPLPENIKAALDFHTKKYGLPPNILERSNKLSSFPNVEGVECSLASIPPNLLLIGVKR